MKDDIIYILIKIPTYDIRPDVFKHLKLFDAYKNIVFSFIFGSELIKYIFYPLIYQLDCKTSDYFIRYNKNEFVRHYCLFETAGTVHSIFDFN